MGGLATTVEVEREGSASAPTAEKLYWLGNVAKVRVIREILRRSRGRAVVFDYGAGTGGDWPQILADHPQLELIAYEPCAPSAKKLRQLQSNRRATVVEDLEAAQIQADYIVSFSVFEHVYDRRAYLTAARRRVADNGVMFLNYDDGHFRQSCDLSRPRTWPNALIEHTQNILAPLWPKIGRKHLYQARVNRNDCDALLAATGWRTADERYENLASYKQLSKAIPPDEASKFAHFWLESEERLNQDFRRQITPDRGDATNLWREMASRTLELHPV